MRDATVMSPDDIRRAVTRIAHEIVEHNRGTQDLVFVGMLTRGVPLAHRIARAIAEFEGRRPVSTLGVGSCNGLTNAAPPSTSASDVRAS
jgi:pyrimidine operon attenuation protein/uracil phosphoribosyltransferase